jgi:hypothetical protein
MIPQKFEMDFWRSLPNLLLIMSREMDPSRGTLSSTILFAKLRNRIDRRRSEEKDPTNKILKIKVILMLLIFLNMKLRNTMTTESLRRCAD